MNLVRLALRSPWSVLVLVVAVCLGATLALQRMARDAFPPLGVPTIYVAQPFGGMDPAQMEGYITYYYEYHFLYITGIEHVESKSIQGASLMKLQFHPGTDMAAAMSEVVAYVNRSRSFMPAGTPGAFVTRFDAGSVPVGYLVFSTDDPNVTVGQMQDAALNRVRPLFATLPGVSAPPPFGGSARTIVINAKPDRLRAYGLSPDDLVQAMTAANILSPSGNMNLGDKYPIVPVNAVPKNIQDLAAVPLRVTPQGAVFLRDVATVEDSADLVTSYALANGRRTVYIPVTKRADASTLSVVNLVKSNLAKFQAAVPDTVKVSYEFDQSPVVNQSIATLTKEGALGALLTGLMVLLFLRDWRSALIVVVNIPIALLAATFALWITGQSLNLMTLSGLALAVGILVDEATVAVENIHAHLARGTPLARAALEATRETALPRLLAMLCIVAVFIPAFFMVGAAKALFTPLALAVGFSMIASFFLSGTLVPVLSVWFLRRHQQTATHADPAWLVGLQKFYTALVRPFIAARWLVLPLYLAAAFGLISVFGPHLGLEIFPAVDSGQLAIRFRGAAGTKVEKTEAVAKHILDTINREASATNVAITIGLVGVHASNYPVNLIYLFNTGPEEGWLAVQLKPGSGVKIETLKEKLRAVFAAELPDIRVSFEPSDLVSRVMSFGSPTPIEVAVSGPSFPASREFAEKIAAKLRTLPNLRDVHIAQSLDFPTVDVQVDRERAGLLGVRTSDVTRSLVAATTSSRFTTANYWADPGSGISMSLQVQIPQSQTNSLEDLRNIPISSSAPGGKPVLLRNVANLTPGTAPGQYERYNLVRVVSVTANLHNTDLGTASRQIAAAVAELGEPPAKGRVDYRGQVGPLTELTEGFSSGLLIAIAVIFLLLTANFQSLRLAFVVIVAVPGVLAGVVLALKFTGTTLNLQSAIGAIMAVGVAIANAILLVTFADRDRRRTADPAASALSSATSRLRPILMTTCAMGVGMLPLALGLGEGGDQVAPLGRAVLGGLALGTLATLFILPPVFAILAGRNTESPSLDPDDETSPLHQAAQTLNR